MRAAARRVSIVALGVLAAVLVVLAAAVLLRPLAERTIFGDGVVTVEERRSSAVVREGGLALG